jgi:hypothetical protein
MAPFIFPIMLKLRGFYLTLLPQAMATASGLIVNGIALFLFMLEFCFVL